MEKILDPIGTRLNPCLAFHFAIKSRSKNEDLPYSVALTAVANELTYMNCSKCSRVTGFAMCKLFLYVHTHSLAL
jgi:hypothetical protein